MLRRKQAILCFSNGKRPRPMQLCPSSMLRIDFLPPSLSLSLSLSRRSSPSSLASGRQGGQPRSPPKVEGGRRHRDPSPLAGVQVQQQQQRPNHPGVAAATAANGGGARCCGGGSGRRWWGEGAERTRWRGGGGGGATQRRGKQAAGRQGQRRRRGGRRGGGLRLQGGQGLQIADPPTRCSHPGRPPWRCRPDEVLPAHSSPPGHTIPDGDAAGRRLYVFELEEAVEGLLASDGPRRRKERHVLTFWLPPVEGSAVLAIALAFAWQKAVRAFPTHFTVRFIIWFSFASSMSAGILLLCFSMPATDGAGVALILFAVGNGLYACWVTRRTAFAAKVLARSLYPAEAKFRTLNRPAYLMMLAGFVWISLWCFAVIGAHNFYYPPLTVLALVLSLMWTAEVMRNVANVTVSRVVALYYLRGMQSDVGFCFQRALTRNLGSACLGSLFVPAIEACRIIARGLNLLEGEDEFMFSCAHCCLHVMEAIFRYGNSWAFVHIAAYGRGFVEASQSTWGLFVTRGLEPVVDSDITSSVCFLTGVSSGSLCVIFAASWTFSAYRHYTATVSLLAFFVGYLMTRIGMALPQACVGCYYVCYAENPTSRTFTHDPTIPNRLELIRSGRDVPAATPRIPRRFTAAA